MGAPVEGVEETLDEMRDVVAAADPETMADSVAGPAAEPNPAAQSSLGDTAAGSAAPATSTGGAGNIGGRGKTAASGLHGLVRRLLWLVGSWERLPVHLQTADARGLRSVLDPHRLRLQHVATPAGDDKSEVATAPSQEPGLTLVVEPLVTVRQLHRQVREESPQVPCVINRCTPAPHPTLGPVFITARKITPAFGSCVHVCQGHRREKRRRDGMSLLPICQRDENRRCGKLQ